MKGDHTPGPWKQGKNGRIESDHNEAGGCAIVVNERAIGDYRNARLIAAAPDLLAALEKIANTHGDAAAYIARTVARAAIKGAKK